MIYWYIWTLTLHLIRNQILGPRNVQLVNDCQYEQYIHWIIRNQNNISPWPDVGMALDPVWVAPIEWTVVSPASLYRCDQAGLGREDSRQVTDLLLLESLLSAGSRELPQRETLRDRTRRGQCAHRTVVRSSSRWATWLRDITSLTAQTSIRIPTSEPARE